MPEKIRDELPEGILITWSHNMMTRGGKVTPEAFRRYFEKVMANEDQTWLQKCKNEPRHPVAYVYIIIANKVEYRLFYAGFEKGAIVLNKPIGEAPGDEEVEVDWNRLVLTGPVQKAPHEIVMRGFQGFRYTHKLF